MSEVALSPTAAKSDASSLRYLVPLGRAMFAVIFLVATPGHFKDATIEFARAQGVPLAGIAVPFTGLLTLAGGLSVLLGYRARIGAALLVVFMVPTTLMMHKFWTIPDPMMRMMDQVMFMKNVALTGTALLMMYFGAGPISFDARRRD